MKGSKGVAGRGILAGLVAGAALILWFFVVDLFAGAPLRTPVFLAEVLLSPARPVLPGTLLIALYTLLHFAVFALVGLFVAWVIKTVHPRAVILLGVVVGFLLFDLMFYASLLITGVNVVNSLGWPTVLVGTVIAGLVLMGTLYFTGVARPASWLRTLRQSEILRQGMAAGLLAASVVAVWFLIFDLVTRQPFYTPAALGSAIFFGATSPAGIEITSGTVLAYSLFHFGAFMLVGIIVSALFTGAERSPALLLGFVLAFVVFEVVFFGALTFLAQWLLNALGWWSITIANLLAAIVLVGYLWRAHPHLRETLTGPSLEERILP